MNPARREVDVEIFDVPPVHSETEGLPWHLKVPARGWVELEYRLRPTQRGDHEFGKADLLLRQRGDLWRGEPAEPTIANACRSSKRRSRVTSDHDRRVRILDRCRELNHLTVHSLSLDRRTADTSWW